MRPEPPLGGEVGAVNPLARLTGSNRFRHRRHKTKHHLLHMPTKFLLSAMREQAQQICSNLED